jgi:carbonic anhydrase/acetyltransferase-like protein (isoleucine patch superfamily)
MLVRHRGHEPLVDPSAFIVPTATLVGDVRVGPRARVMSHFQPDGAGQWRGEGR